MGLKEIKRVVIPNAYGHDNNSLGHWSPCCGSIDAGWFWHSKDRCVSATPSNLAGGPGSWFGVKRRNYKLESSSPSRENFLPAYTRNFPFFWIRDRKETKMLSTKSQPVLALHCFVHGTIFSHCFVVSLLVGGHP